MIFVTGGTGLVGSHVLLKLSQQGNNFRALKRSSSSLKICQKVFSYYNEIELFEKISWVEGDINDIGSLEDAIQGCTMVLHCAAIVSFSPYDVDLMKKVNTEGTANVVNVALDAGVQKIGYVSSIATLGTTKNNTIINESCNFKFTKNISNYSITKYFAEQEVWRAAAEGIDVIIINPSVILGPGDWQKGSSQIFEKIYNGLNFYSTGSTGYVDVVDVADILVQLLFSSAKNERYIVNGINLKYQDCFNKIAEAMSKPKARIKVTPFLKEVAWRIEALRSFVTGKSPLITRETANSAMSSKAYDSKKIKSFLSFEFTDFDSTIRKYVSWFLADQE